MSDVICSLEGHLGLLSHPHRRNKLKATSKRCVSGRLMIREACELNPANFKDKM